MMSYKKCLARGERERDRETDRERETERDIYIYIGSVTHKAVRPGA